MAKRLSERFPPSAEVEFTFDGESWQPGTVLGSDPPGLWVRDGQGYVWFVTNGRRIRNRTPDEK